MSVHRFNVNFSEQAYETLRALAASRGKSMAEVLRDAIALERWFHETLDEGCKVLVEKPDGRIHEVIPR